jgi:hypothetical protein
VMEAFHCRYRPLALRSEQIIASGELGTLERVEATLCYPLPMFSDIRYNYSLMGAGLPLRKPAEGTGSAGRGLTLQRRRCGYRGAVRPAPTTRTAQRRSVRLRLWT